jgi:hypothetical protein
VGQIKDFIAKLSGIQAEHQALRIRMLLAVFGPFPPKGIVSLAACRSWIVLWKVERVLIARWRVLQTQTLRRGSWRRRGGLSF